MKYAGFLEEQLAPFPSHARDKCIPYRQWKILIKSNPVYVRNNWKTILKINCRTINRYLYPWFGKSLVDEQCVRFLGIINTTTLYKLSKKLDRHLDVGAMEYMAKIIRERKYRFTRCSFETLV
jgi:hypothetical protein